MKFLKIVIHISLDNTYTHHIGIYPKNNRFVSTQWKNTYESFHITRRTSSNIVAVLMTVDHSS